MVNEKSKKAMYSRWVAIKSRVVASLKVKDSQIIAAVKSGKLNEEAIESIVHTLHKIHPSVDVASQLKNLLATIEQHLRK